MAGSSTSLSVGTAPIFSTDRSICASTPSFLRRRMCQCSASSGSMPAVGSAASASSACAALPSKWAMKRSSASSRRLSTRSSASSRSVSSISAYGVMWFGLTIARSSPASTQWCRKTEFRTERAGSPTPNETLETPSEVSTPGSCLLDQADALDRLDRGRPPLLVARGERERERVEDQQLGSIPCSSQTSSWMRSRDLELALARLGHPDLVDRQRDQRGAVRDGDRRDAVELVAAGLEVDRVDDRAAGDLLERVLDHLGLGRVDLDRRGLGERDLLGHEPHLLVLVLALGQRDAQVEHVRAALDLVLGDLDEAVVVVGEQQLLRLARALRVDALADERRRGVLGDRRRGHHRGDVRRARRGARAGRAARRRAPRSPRCARSWCRSSRRRSTTP